MPGWLGKLEQELLKYQTTVKFSENALSDFKSFDAHTKKVILALILSQAKRGAQFRPDGNGIRFSTCIRYSHNSNHIDSGSVSSDLMYE